MKAYRGATHCCLKNLICLKKREQTTFAYTYVHEIVTEKNPEFRLKHEM